MSPSSIHSGHRAHRDLPAVFEVARGAWLWAARVPYLPDIGYDRDQIESPVSIAGYHALAEAVAATAPGGSAVQIRLLGSGELDGEPGVVRPVMIGRGRSESSAQRLAALARATVPTEVALEPIATREELDALLHHVAVPQEPLAAAAEVRRRIEEVDPVPGSALADSRMSPGVLRWNSDPFGLRMASTVLSRHRPRAVIVLHMEPATPSLALLDSLDAVVREITAVADPADNPLRRQIALDNLRRLRNLPRAALQVRIAVAAEGGIEPGLLESIGISSTSEEAFVVVRPQNEFDHLWLTELFQTATARWWGGTDDPLIDELQRICDTAEAASLVRLPAPLRGGSPGLSSVPLSTLPRSALTDMMEGPAVYLGPGTGGGKVVLTLAEINRHLLVSGLPGFGKTVTTQRILARLWQEHGIPSLVIDPAKTDYDQLTAALGEDALHVRLTPDEPGFNPFAVPQGVSPHSHAGRVLAAFDSALGLSGHWPMGYVTLARGLFAAYENFDDAGSPTLRSLYAQVGDTLRRTSLAGPDGANARAALLARLEFLARGPLGAALIGGPDGGVDWGDLLSRPVVIELRDFSGPAERALTFALLLAGLISYREAHPTPGRLGHVTVLEEAHRVLRQAEEESEGVRLFVEAIAEMRGSGEGFIIVDQAPTQLHAGVLKHSGSILTHRLVDPSERSVVGSAVLLDERQQQDLARLAIGQAVLFSSRRVASTVVDVDDTAIIEEARGSADRRSHLAAERSIELPFCIGCLYTCVHERNGRRLSGQFPPRTLDPAAVVDHFSQKTRDRGLARCATGMAGAGAWTGSLSDFLVWLRRVEDHLQRSQAPRNAELPKVRESETPGGSDER